MPLTSETYARRLLLAAVPLLVGLVLVLGGHDARANMAKWWSEGEAHGTLVPQDDSDVRVDSEDLSFVVAPSLDRADVVATYHMTNGGKAATHAQVAFVMVVSENAQRAPASVAHASVTIDGEPLAGLVRSEADVLEPALDAWLAAHRDAEAELARLAAESPPVDYRALRGYAPGCTGDCGDLVAWYRARKSEAKPASDEARRELVLRAAEAAVPGAVTALQNGWSTLKTGRRPSWLTFPLEIAAGATRTVTVRYTHVAGSDSSHAVSTVFTYEYLLSPAKRWARFGDLHVTIQVPPNAMVRASSLASTEEAGASGTTYRTTLSGLPAGELSFEVMSRKGLLFGMTQPTGYWLLLVAGMAVVTVPIARRLGRLWARAGSRLGTALGCILGTGAGALVVNVAVASALSASFPVYAFGHGYATALGLVALVLGAALSAVALSAMTASRARR